MQVDASTQNVVIAAIMLSSLGAFTVFYHFLALFYFGPGFPAYAVNVNVVIAEI
jgi:hypothetical protein